MKNTHTEVDILQVKNIFKCRNTILVNLHKGKYSSIKKIENICTEVYILRVEAILSVEYTILVNSHKGKYSSMKKIIEKFENYLHRGEYSTSSRHF